MDQDKRLKGARVAIYARFSSQRQREASIDDQVQRCRSYIAQAGGDADEAIVFSDYAISGASLDRPGFEGLMAAVHDRRVDAIVTEDISRISRDFADSASVFKQLQFAQIPLISIADGIDTRNRDAKLTFTLKSLVADLYLEDLRDKTLRGLEGRARAGYATGQVPYGYLTSPETDSLRRTIGSKIEIDPDNAAIVRRIFALYRDGFTLAGIARTLNADGVPSPRAGTRHKQSGWGASTIRAMLYNECYVGVWRFKQSQWVKVPGSNRRRPQKRPSDDVMLSERPHLRIIAAAEWDAVRARLHGIHRKYTTSDGAPKRTVASAGRRRYLLSGLLNCGLCGSPMSIMTGASAAYYRCSARRKGGSCQNERSCREDVARSEILSALRSAIATPEARAFARRHAEEQLREMRCRVDPEIDRRRRTLADIEAQIHALVSVLANGDRSSYVVAALRDLESRVKHEKAWVKRFATRPHTATATPSAEEVIAAAFDVEALMQGDIPRAREQLRRFLDPGQISMMPDANGYRAHADAIGVIRIQTTCFGEDERSDR